MPPWAAATPYVAPCLIARRMRPSTSGVSFDGRAILLALDLAQPRPGRLQPRPRPSQPLIAVSGIDTSERKKPVADCRRRAYHRLKGGPRAYRRRLRLPLMIARNAPDKRLRLSVWGRPARRRAGQDSAGRPAPRSL